MNDRLREYGESGVATLLGGIVGDAQALLKQELALAKREVAEEINKAKEAAVSFGAGIGIAAVGGLLIAFALVYLLQWAFPDYLPLWLCYAIVGAVLAVGGGILVVMGKKRASDIHMVPEQTVATMKDNLKWIKNQT
jgi:hypothetical protein